MENKQEFVFEIKELSEEGTFEGLLSPYGNVDQGGDVVEPGAYTKTLKEGGNKRPLLYQHDEPIGELELEDRKEGLWAKGKLLMDLPDAKKAYLLIKNNIVKGLSIGYRTIKDSVEGGVRHLKEIKLLEGSIVTFPMNEMALIESVKAGARFSSSTKSAMNAAIAQIKGAHDSLLALLSEDAGEEPTLPEKAAKPEEPQPAAPVVEAKAEPEEDHSEKELSEGIAKLRSLIPAA